MSGPVITFVGFLGFFAGTGCEQEDEDGKYFGYGRSSMVTGGTIKAAWKLVKKLHPKQCYMNFLIEIRDEGLTGREFIGDGIEITTLIRV